MKDRGDGKTFYDWAKATWPTMGAIDPKNWPTEPNVVNPLVPSFNPKDGIEIPDGLQNYCEVVQGQPCTNPVAAEHYMLYTGDGEIPGLWKSIEGMGNALTIWNVGKVTGRFDGIFHQGWRNTGRYFNGDTLPIAIVAEHSNTANVMHNMNSKLNPNPMQNAGANCSVINGCDKVQHTVIITSGNEVLLIATVTTTK